MRTKKLKSMIIVFSLALTSMAVQSQTTVEDIDPITPLGPSTETSQIKDKLIGSWLLEANTANKVVFTADNKLKRYYGGVLQSTETFTINNTCDDETLSSGYFLITTSATGSKGCMYIDNIDCNNSGRLTLVSKEQGKIIVYKKI